jgi:NTP pyrophosphatase (non-canonical NTP hydrolase)
MTIEQLCNAAVLASQTKGFHSPSPTDLEKIALIMSELGEAVEELRTNNEAFYYKAGKPEGVLTELADAVIRIADMCGYRGWDLEDAIIKKMKYNETRPHKHGKII